MKLLLYIAFYLASIVCFLGGQWAGGLTAMILTTGLISLDNLTVQSQRNNDLLAKILRLQERQLQGGEGADLPRQDYL